MQRACYTSPLDPMPLQRPFFRHSISLVVLVFLISQISQAQQEVPSDSSWTKPAHDLVWVALSDAGSPSSVSPSFENRSTMSVSEFAQARKAIEAQLRAAKVRLVKPEAAIAEIKFTFSENAAGYLWIAEVVQGPTRKYSMLPIARPAAATSVVAASLEIRANLLVSQSEPILDVVVAADGLLLLQPDSVALYKKDANGLKRFASLQVNHPDPWPRDLRGRIFLNEAAFEVFLPGTHCTGSTDSKFALNCQESDDPWPFMTLADVNVPRAFFSSRRNFFSGVLGGSEAGHSVSPFFSAASIGEGENRLWLMAGTDGRTRMFNRFSQPMKTITSQGSDLAAVQSGCGSRWQLLASSATNVSQADSVQAFEIQNKDLVKVSEAISFTGPVTAMWSGHDRQFAFAVVKNRNTDQYEAYSLSITCSR